MAYPQNIGSVSVGSGTLGVGSIAAIDAFSIVVGTPSGLGPRVTVYTVDSATQLTSTSDFFAFDTRFMGGVVVGGNGFGGFAVGTGPGGGSLIEVYNKGSTTPYASFAAFDAGFKGGMSLDMIGPSYVVAAAGAGAGPLVKVFDAAQGGKVIANFFAFDAAFTGGVTVAVTSDGKLAVGTGKGTIAQVKIYDVSTLDAAGGPTLLETIVPFGTAFKGGVSLAALSDGKLAIGTASGSSRVKVYDADGTVESDFLAFSETSGVVLAGFNDRLLVGSGAGSAPIVKTFEYSLVSFDFVSIQDTGIRSYDRITSSDLVTIYGTYSAESGVTSVKLYDGATLLGTATLFSQTWQISAQLTEGRHPEFRAVAYNEAGEEVAMANNLIPLVVDKTAPGRPRALDLRSDSDTGASNADNDTADVTPTITGKAEAGSIVTLYDGTTVVGTTTATGDGVFTVTASKLTLGDHHLRAVATDLAGNASAKSTVLDITIHADVAPVANNDTGTALEAGRLPGKAATGNVLTNDTGEAGNHLAVSMVALGSAHCPAGIPLRGQYGLLIMKADGSYTYAVDDRNAKVDALVKGETLKEVFTYTVVSQGGLPDTAKLTITIKGANGESITGTSSGESLKGTVDGDVVSGLGGADTVTGGAGRDTLTGGTGQDHFVFALGDSGIKTTNADTITDWTVSDAIDTLIKGTSSNYYEHSVAASVDTIEEAATYAEAHAGASVRHAFLFNSTTDVGYLLMDLDSNGAFETGVILNKAGTAAEFSYSDLI